jgi:predicted nucleic acid-binding protein
MMFWDASALIPILIEGPQTKTIKDIVKKDSDIVVWWGSYIECFSAFARLRREGFLKVREDDQLRNFLTLLSDNWTEIEPGKDIRDTAERLLLSHPLRAADSLQLASALIWTGKNPKGNNFVCLDQRLKTAARKEGFTILF